ncbi:glycosyltransferase [Chloroflexota bacterium]
MPYKIALLSKYPPLEGGIAAKTYWLASGLTVRGHEIHVITDGISSGQEYQIEGSERELASTPNLWIHRPPNDIPWHIPEDNEHTLALLDLTLNVIREHSIQILDTGYFIPYGILGHLAKFSTGAYHVVRHDGSDVEKFLKRQVLGTLLNEAIAHADRVVTNTHYRDLLEPLTSRLAFQPEYVPDDSMFTTNNARHPQWRLAVIGKINYHWQHKNLHLIADIMRQLTGQFECWVVGQGKGMADFQQSLGSETVVSFKWYPFVAPWEMPQLLNQLDAIFIFELGLPHPAVSNLALEAISSGVGIITDRADFIETYRDIVEIDKNQVIVISPSELSSAMEMIEPWVRERARNIQSSHPLVSYQEYLSANESIYANILGYH